MSTPTFLQQFKGFMMLMVLVSLVPTFSLWLPVVIKILSR